MDKSRLLHFPAPHQPFHDFGSADQTGHTDHNRFGPWPWYLPVGPAILPQ